MSTTERTAVRAIVAAGLLCGVLDISAAFLTWIPQGVYPARLLQGIASGALGRDSFDGGLATAALGLSIHFLIAFIAATVFYGASRKLTFLTERPLVFGPPYGVAVYLVMYWIVMPLSRLNRRPVTLSYSLLAIVTHIVCVGTPIALMVSRFGPIVEPASAGGSPAGSPST
jgi:hypothetical protein